MANQNHTSHTVEIPLTRGYVAIVDEQDADLALFKWTAQETKSGHVYAFRYDHGGKGRKRLYMHREIYQRKAQIILTRKQLIDHKNNDGLDNTRCNLRLTDYVGNRANSKLNRTSTSNFKGVSWESRSGKWKAGIKVNKKDIYLGSFDDPELAHQAYCEAAKKYFGEFARTI